MKTTVYILIGSLYMKNTTISKSEQLDFRGILAKPEGSHILIAALFLFFSLLVIPFADIPNVCGIYIVCCAVLYYALSRSFFAMLYYAVPAFLLYSFGAFLPGSPDPLMLPTVFLALLVGGGCGAFVLIHFHDPKKHLYLLLLPILAYTAATLITGDPVRGLLTLLPTALAIVAAVCVLLYMRRTDATVLIAVALAAVLAIAGLVTLGVTGGFVGNPIVTLADTVRASITAFLTEARSLYTEMGMRLSLSDVDISNTAALLVNLLPGLFLCACSITAFLVWRTLLQLMVAFRTLPKLPFRLAAFSMSKTSAVVFLLFYIVALFANSAEATLFGTVCQNVALVLEPGLALIGFASIFSRGGARSCLSYVLVFGLLFILWTNPATGVALAAFFGAFHILAAQFLPQDNSNKGDR